MKDVKNLLQKKYSQQNPVTIQDLVKEIDNLKEQIKILQHNNNSLNYRISVIENNNISNTGSFENIQDISFPDDNQKHLSVLSMIISQKWYTNITLLIDNSYKKNFIAMIDSGADLNVIQEK